MSGADLNRSAVWDDYGYHHEALDEPASPVPSTQKADDDTDDEVP